MNTIHAFLCGSLIGLVAFAQLGSSARADDDTPEPESFEAASTLADVSLYQGRAMITRVAVLPEREGLFELRFANLPASIDAGSVQATVSAPLGGSKLLDVRFEAVAKPNDVSTNPQLRQAIADLESAKRRRELLALEAQRITDQNTLLNSIAAKTATESAKDFGSKSLDTAALSAQVSYLSAARKTLIEERMVNEEATREADRAREALAAKVQALGGESRVERTAFVTVGKSSAAPGSVALRYLVTDATWMPRYNVRADMDASTLVVEYDADIRQATGEDWTNIALTLSTAQPTQRAQPNFVNPIALDIYVPPPPSTAAAHVAPESEFLGRRRSSASTKDASESDSDLHFGAAMMVASAAPTVSASYAENSYYRAAFDDASAVQSGTVATFPLPRRVTIPSDAQKARNLRIATIDLKPTFVHVAQPIVDSAVYLKATASNTSSYQLLTGPVAVFLGSDSVGRTSLPDLAPGSEMTFWLGTDRRIEAKRTTVSKDTTTEGVFDKREVTRWQERIELTSTLDSRATVEVVDRIPVSHNEQIKVEITTCTPALATDAKYLKDERPFGILKWVIPIAARAKDGPPVAGAITWTTTISKPPKALVTGMPN